MTSETDYPVDESAMSTSTPVLDRVERAPRPPLHAGRRRALAPHPRRHADRAGRARVRRPRGLFLPAPAGAPGSPRRGLHLRRGLAAELTLQVRGGRDVVLRRGELADDHAHAARRGRRLRRHDPLRPGLVRALPDAAGPRRRAHPPARLHAGAVDPAPAGGGAAVQPRRLLVRRPGRNDEPPHQPVPVRSGHHRLGAVQRRGRSAVGQHARPVRSAVPHAGRVVRLAHASTTRCSRSSCCACSRWPASP